MTESQLLNTAGQITDAFNSRLQSVAKSLLGGLENALGSVGDVLSGIWGIAKRVGARVWQGVTGLFEVAANVFSFAWNIAQRAGRFVWNVVTGLFEAVANVFSFAWGIAQRVGRAVWGSVGFVFQGVVALFSGLWNVTRSIRQAIGSTIMGWLTGLFNGLRTALGQVWQTVLTLVRGAAQGLGSLLQSAWGLIGSIPYVGPALQIAGAVAGVALLVRGVYLLGGALGAAGRAIAGVATGAFNLARGFGASALSLGRSAMSTVATRGGALLGGASSFAGGVVQRGGAMLGGLSGSLNVGGAGSMLSSVGGTISKMVSTFLGAVFQVGKALFSLVSVGVAAGLLTKAIIEAATGAMEFAQSARTLSAQTGLSLDRSASLMRDLSALGIKGAPTGNAGIFAMKASVYGLPGIDSPDFAARYAQKFQSLQSSGLGGQLMASGMAKILGLDSPEWMRTATMRPGAIREQQNYTRSVNAQLGLTPEALRRYSEEIPLFLNKVIAVWEGLKMKLAATALPLIESVLGGVTRWLGKNAGQIGGWIEYAVKWLFVKAPLQAVGAVSTILGVVQQVINGVLVNGSQLMNDLPALLGGMVQWMADMLRNMADSFGQYGPILIGGVADGLANFGAMVGGWMIDFGKFVGDVGSNSSNPFRHFVRGLAIGIDLMINVLRNGAAEIIGTARALLPRDLTNIAWTRQDFVNDAANSLGGTSTPVTNAFDNWMKTHPLDDSSKAIQAQGQALINSTQARANQIRSGGTAAVNAVTGRVNAAADWLDPNHGQGGNKGEKAGEWMAGKIAPVLDFIGTKVKPGVDNLANMVQGYGNSLGSEGDRDARLDELISVQKEQLKVAQQSLKDGKDLPRNMMSVVGYMMAAQAEQQGRAILGQ